MKFNLVLKRRGRFKKPFYNIVIVNLRNRIVDKVGVYNPFKLRNTKKIELNLLLLVYWLAKGLKQSIFLSKFLKIFFI
jgi:ribosomal protein S16